MNAMFDAGGPMFDISVGGKIYHFEMNQFAGPNVLNRRGEPLKHQPMEFLKAASLWCQQGHRVEKGLCVWEYQPEPIVKHLGGQNWEITGWGPAVRGA